MKESSTGQYLKECRVTNEITQKEVARKLGLYGPQFVYNVESGRSKLPANLLKEWADFVGAEAWVVSKLMCNEIVSEYKKKIHKQQQKEKI